MLLFGTAEHVQLFHGAGERDVEHADRLVRFLFLGGKGDGLAQGRRERGEPRFVRDGGKQSDLGGEAEGWGFSLAAKRVARVGKNADGGFETLGFMNGHHAHGIRFSDGLLVHGTAAKLAKLGDAL